jgi:Pyruvate/2-oxoacid:ferredoxin oxidoreductase delta subunit
LRKAPSPFAIIECICRKKKSIEGKFCSVTDRKETCLAIGSMAQTVLLSGTGRKIARDEAISILQQNQEQGLVLQPSNTELVEFICSCCGCCCGMLRLHQNLPRPLDFWVSNFHAVVNAGICEGCGACEGWCQVGAVSVAGSGSSRKAVVDLNRCLGCGICIINCPAEAISLLKKPAEAVPPKTREDLYETIMSHKKGRLGKMQLAAKMIIDIVRTGHTKLLGR